MSDASELLLRVAALAGIAAAWLTGTWTWQARHRWGSVPATSTVLGEGPYRRAIARRWIPRGAPGRVAFVAGMGVAWGLLTSAVLAPAGLVFLLAPARVDPRVQIVLTLSGLFVFGTALSGFALGGSLVRASRALLEREHDVQARAIPVATWSAIHHASVLVAFALFAAHERDASIAFAVAVPCSIGVAHAWALAHTARFVARADVADDAGPRASSSPTDLSPLPHTRHRL